MSDRLERFLGSTKRRYFLGFLGAGLALGLGVLGGHTSLTAGQLKLPQVYNASKEKVGVGNVTIQIGFFDNDPTKRANFTTSVELESGKIVYLTLDNAMWNRTDTSNVTNTALCFDNNTPAANYHSISNDNKTLRYTVGSIPIPKNTVLYFANSTCNGSQPVNATIPKGTTSDVKISVEYGDNKVAEATLIKLMDQWSIKEIKSARAYINATDNTKFKQGNNVNSTSANATISLSNATLDAYATYFNATVALDKFPSWLNNVTSSNPRCVPHFNSTNYQGANANNCTGTSDTTLTFCIKGNETLSPTKIALSKYEITKVDGVEYTKDLLSAYSGDKTLLEVLYDGLVLYIPRFDHRKEGNPKTYVNLATTRSGAKVRVCKFGGSCYDNEISLDKEVKNLFQREPAIEDFLGGYSGALRLEFINLTNPAELVCYTVFVRGDGTVVRVPCLEGRGVEGGAK